MNRPPEQFVVGIFLVKESYLEGRLFSGSYHAVKGMFIISGIVNVHGPSVLFSKLLVGGCGITKTDVGNK